MGVADLHWAGWPSVQLALPSRSHSQSPGPLLGQPGHTSGPQGVCVRGSGPLVPQGISRSAQGPGAWWGSTPAMIPSSSCRVKSEAITARREPKEEVEDVSSYLCTELVYSTINMWGMGGGPRGVGSQGPPSPLLSSPLPFPGGNSPLRCKDSPEESPLFLGVHNCCRES